VGWIRRRTKEPESRGLPTPVMMIPSSIIIIMTLFVIIVDIIVDILIQSFSQETRLKWWERRRIP
jgi:hypothetical protein